MNAFLGADTDAVRQLADRFAVQSQRLLELGDQIIAMAQAVDWRGTDAEEFRARAAAVTGELGARSGEVQARAADLQQHAEEQDMASGTDGAGPWQSVLDFFAGITPWGIPSPGMPGTPSTLKERVRDVIEDLAKDRAWEAAGDTAKRLLDTLGSPRYWGDGFRKAIPLLPDLYDAGQHAADGESREFVYAVTRAAYDFHPVAGAAETVSSWVFPLAPDSWKMPGTDRSINEGSMWDHIEAYMIEDTDPNSRFNVAMREGEAIGLGYADRLGIENQTVRNLFKTAGGAGGYVGEGQVDENGNVPIISLTPEQRERIGDFLN